MSKRPTGTTTDRDRLLELRETDETTASTLAVDVTPLADRQDVDSDEWIDWDVDERDGLPMLVFGRIDEPETADAPYPRQLRAEDDGVVAPVPDPLAEAEPPEGLGLDLDADDPSRGLLFEADVLAETIGLVPVRFGDGEPYGAEPLPGVAAESDPVAEETIAHESGGDPTPRPETMNAPIDPEILDDAMADVAGVPVADVIGILEAIHRHDVVGEGDTVAGYPPLSVDERAVCTVAAGTWEDELAPRLEAAGVDVDADALAAARAVHERQALRLIETSEAEEYRDAAAEHDLVVTDERDTAEWEVSEPGTSR